MPRPILLVTLLLALCFTLATSLQLRTERWTTRTDSDGILKILLGDGRRMFANHFFVKADVYFHSGYYPSIFDQAASVQTAGSRHMTEVHEDHDEHDGHDGHAHEESAHEKAMNFLGQPRDWIDRFGRNFYSSKHSHLDHPGEAREILPWLRISADLDPQRVETYTVASYWLRNHLGKVAEAEQFLREGLRANPSSYEILFELGDLYDKNHKDPVHARNLWELALRRYREQEAADKHPDIFVYQQIVTNLAILEEQQGDLAKALYYRELEVKVSPTPGVVQKQIDELKQKLAGRQDKGK